MPSPNGTLDPTFRRYTSMFKSNYCETLITSKLFTDTGLLLWSLGNIMSLSVSVFAQLDMHSKFEVSTKKICCSYTQLQMADNFLVVFCLHGVSSSFSNRQLSCYCRGKGSANKAVCKWRPDADTVGSWLLPKWWQSGYRVMVEKWILTIKSCGIESYTEVFAYTLRVCNNVSVWCG